MKLFGRADPEAKGLADLEKGVEEFKEGVAEEEDQLKELFASLKTDLLDEFLTPGTGHLKRAHLKILGEQVRHVISVARAIGYKELIQSFEQEEKVLEQVRDLVDAYPEISVSTSPDLRASQEKHEDQRVDKPRSSCFS